MVRVKLVLSGTTRGSLAHGGDVETRLTREGGAPGGGQTGITCGDAFLRSMIILLAAQFRGWRDSIEWSGQEVNTDFLVSQTAKGSGA